MIVSDDVLGVLSRAKAVENRLFLVDQLDRKLYERTSKVIEAAGGKWMRKEKSHVFDVDAAERIEQVLLTGRVEVPKDEFDFFPSPPPVVARLMELARIEPGMLVLEPSAGRGAIALECARAGAIVDCVERMQSNCEHLKNLGEFNLICDDFLKVELPATYDRVVMNPPFSRQADIDHVLRAHRFLKKRSGLLVSVMGAGVTFRENGKTRAFRETVSALGGRIEMLPDGAFRESGTMVRSVVVVMPAG